MFKISRADHQMYKLISLRQAQRKTGSASLKNWPCWFHKFIHPISLFILTCLDYLHLCGILNLYILVILKTTITGIMCRVNYPYSLISSGKQNLNISGDNIRTGSAMPCSLIWVILTLSTWVRHL